MYFEISERDSLGRIGTLETKMGRLETPALLPVVNPLAQEIPPRMMFERFGCRALITNAYLIKRRTTAATITDIHDFLDFPGVVATDSGAYQILRYGEVDITPSEIVRYEQSIQTDIGVILDVPTGSRASKTHAMQTVRETIRRADEAQQVITRHDIRWVGPIQGGMYLDLVALSAREMSKRPFDIHALGSPTEVMEQYLFADLVNMIFAAKMNLPPNRPLHLFGAGHPFMLSLAVASGCDLFDSAAYILYARRNRYLTQAGTLKLGQMRYFPCKCNNCANTSPDEVRSSPATERIRFLAEHNLTVCMQEVDTIKEAIVEGRLWELVELRCRSHPALFQALRRLGKHRVSLASTAPSTKPRGILFFDATSLHRPEYTAQIERILHEYAPPKEAQIALLIPQKYHRSEYASKTPDTNAMKTRKGIHVCLYSPPYGLIPSELESTFPFSQTESQEDPDPETLKAMSKSVQTYLAKNRNYKMLIFLHSGKEWQVRFMRMCRRVCSTTKTRFHGHSDQRMPRGRIEILSRRGKQVRTLYNRRRV